MRLGEALVASVAPPASFVSWLVSSFQLQARRRVRRSNRTRNFISPTVDRSSAASCRQCKRIVGSPMHAFRFAGKLVKHVRAAAQSHPDLLRLPKSPLMRRFLLPCVGKLVTVTTGVPFQRRLTNSRSAAFRMRVRVISDGRVIFSSHSFSNRRLKLMATLRQRECGFVGHRSKKRVPNRRNALTATFIETA